MFLLRCYLCKKGLVRLVIFFFKLPKSEMLSRHQQSVRLVINNIAKSASDCRQYRGLELSNKLKVMLISDPLTDKAAASIDVNIGSLSNPDDLPGLAHFCEHMLFLGSKKYPEEDDYHKFISEHAGLRNATTGPENTKYFFEIGHEYLKETLDRLSHFFYSPLFDASCTDREVNAVHSEHEKNVMSDGWRLRQLDKSTTDPNHKFSKFSTGNKDTLDTIPKSNNISVRNELLKFHHQFYSSNLMSLAVLGKESLDELQNLVVQLFAGIENKDISPLTFETSPYRKEDLQKFVYVVPVKDTRSLIVKFPIPDCRMMYKTSPSRYLGHLIGHEGPNSLLSELKKQGWVNKVLAGEERGARGFSFFKVRFELAEIGLEHIDDILTLMFQYINMIKQNKIQKWVFNEINELNSLNFKFKDKERPYLYVKTVSHSLQSFPLEDALTHGVFLTEFRPDLIESISNKLTPSNVRVYAVAKEFEAIATDTEKWYGTKYHMKDFTSDQIKSWNNARLNPNFSLPPKNDFIPENFHIPSLSNKHSAVPTLIKSEKLSKVWFKQDDQFKLPKACLIFELFSPIAYTEPQSANKVYMFTALLKDSLNEYTYAVELAGLKYSLKHNIYGMQVEIKGQRDKQIILIEKLFNELSTFKINPERFDKIKEKYLMELKSFPAEQPYYHSSHYLNALKSEKFWLTSDRMAALPSLTCAELQEFTKQFMSRLHINILVHGSLKSEDALMVSNQVENMLKQNCGTISLTPSQLSRYREVCIPRGSSYVYQYHNTVRDLSAVELFLQVGVKNKHETILLKLIRQIIKQPCFDVLRTKETLGYIVGCRVNFSNNVQGLSLYVQSEKSPDYLEQRIEAFLHHVKDLIIEMSDDEYNLHVDALTALILEKPKHLFTETSKYWKEIQTEQLQFNRPEIEAEHLRTIPKEEVVKFYNDYIHINAPKRSKLIVHVLAKNLKQCPTTPIYKAEENKDYYPCPELPQSEVIKSLSEFKENLQLYPRILNETDQ